MDRQRVNEFETKNKDKKLKMEYKESMNPYSNYNLSK